VVCDSWAKCPKSVPRIAWKPALSARNGAQAAWRNEAKLGLAWNRDNAPPAKTGSGTGDEAEPGGIARNEANARGPPNSGFGRKVGVKLAISLRGAQPASKAVVGRAVGASLLAISE
jgi:hypothetical protein